MVTYDMVATGVAAAAAVGAGVLAGTLLSEAGQHHKTKS